MSNSYDFSPVVSQPGFPTDHSFVSCLPPVKTSLATNFEFTLMDLFA